RSKPTEADVAAGRDGRVPTPSRARRRSALVVPDDGPLLEVHDGFRNVLGVVGDPLEVPRRAQQGEPGVELGGILSELLLELLANSAILPIDRGVAVDDGPRVPGVADGQGLVGGPDLTEDVAGHRLERLGAREALDLPGTLC